MAENDGIWAGRSQVIPKVLHIDAGHGLVDVLVDNDPLPVEFTGE